MDLIVSFGTLNGASILFRLRILSAYLYADAKGQDEELHIYTSDSNPRDEWMISIHRDKIIEISDRSGLIDVRSITSHQADCIFKIRKYLLGSVDKEGTDIGLTMM